MLKINHFALQTSLGNVLNHTEIAFITFIHNSKKNNKKTFLDISGTRAIELIGSISLRTFYRMTSRLKKLGVLVSEQLSKNRWDRRNHYSLCYEKLEELINKSSKNIQIERPADKLSKRTIQENSDNATPINNQIQDSSITELLTTSEDTLNNSMLQIIAEKYEINKKQLQKVCAGKTVEEIEKTINYINHSLNSGNIDNIGGYIISAFRDNYTFNKQVTKIIEQDIMPSAEELEIIEISRKAYEFYEKGYQRRIDEAKIAFNNISKDSPSPLSVYLQITRKMENYREKAFEVFRQHNILEEFADPAEFRNFLVEKIANKELDFDLSPDNIVFPLRDNKRQQIINRLKDTYLKDLLLRYNSAFRNFLHELKTSLTETQLKLIESLMQTEAQILTLPIEDFDAAKDIMPFHLSFKNHRFETFVNSFLKTKGIPLVEEIQEKYMGLPIEQVIILEAEEILSKSNKELVFNNIKKYLTTLEIECSTGIQEVYSYTQEVLKMRKILQNNHKLIIKEDVRKVLSNTFANISNILTRSLIYESL